MANDIQLKMLKHGVARWNRWRNHNPEIQIDLNRADLSEIHLNGANFNQATLCEVNLSRAHLYKVVLDHADLSYATINDAHLGRASLVKVNLSHANLTRANLNKAELTGSTLQHAQLIAADLSGAELSGANLSGANLIEADLSGTNLQWANLSGANLIGADLSGANLNGANLSYTQVLATDFTAAKLTGACLEGWAINSSTLFSEIECQYVYLREPGLERRPLQGDFKPGDFHKLFQKGLETVELTFPDGIEWSAFLNSFKKLQELQRETGGPELSIQGMENREDGVFIIKIKVPSQTSKAGTREFLKREYDRRLNVLDRRQGQVSSQTAFDRQKNADLMEIVKLLAIKPMAGEAAPLPETSPQLESEPSHFKMQLDKSSHPAADFRLPSTS
ncbi:MAG TPA: pentapeptide repeat-containing protein [Crinalium sp.]